MKKSLALLMPLVMLANACKSDVGGKDYDERDVGYINRAFKCTVLTVSEIDIRNSGVGGAMAGGAAGAIGGGVAGGGGGDAAGAAIGAIGGAVIGGTVGMVSQQGLSKQQGYQYVVEKEDGELAAMAQGDDVALKPGERCIILYGSKRNRIMPFPEEAVKASTVAKKRAVSDNKK